MTLRTRLLLALVGSGVSLLAAIAIARELVVRRAAEAALRASLEARVDALGQERCEEGQLPPPRMPAGPGAGPGGGPPGGGPRGGRGLGRGEPHVPGLRRPGQVFFFGRDFAPRLAGGLAMPGSAREALAGGAAFAVIPWPDGPENAVLAVLRTGWDSERCAYALAPLPAPPSPLSPPSFVLTALAFLGVLAGALYAAAASPVRRIRALAAEMRAAAAQRYQRPVPVQGRDEVAELARAFNEASAAVRAQVVGLEQRERTLRDFVANTTHDVALPLSVLAGQLTELRERLEAGRVPEAATVAAASGEARYIGSLLHNLGAVARLETEDALSERRPLDMRSLVERVALRHAGAAREQGVELNHAVPPEPVAALGDLTLVEQAVSNLVSNAIRYNRAGGHVGLVLDREAGRFALRVVDDGPGVTGEELARLGEPRFRGGEARSRRPEGSGLGLAIARGVAQRHGFQLEFRRPEAGGFEAVLAGPVAASSEPG